MLRLAVAGFLSESPEFAKALAANDITFVGPTVDNLLTFADKTSAREAAIAAGVPVVPGTEGAVTNPEDALEFVESNGLPVIIKAAMGGGGKGMRVVRRKEDLIPFFESASSEAKVHAAALRLATRHGGQCTRPAARPTARPAAQDESGADKSRVCCGTRRRATAGENRGAHGTRRRAATAAASPGGEAGRASA